MNMVAIAWMASVLVSPGDGAMAAETVAALEAAAARAVEAGHPERAARFLRRAWIDLHPEGADPDPEAFEAVEASLKKVDRQHASASKAREEAFRGILALAAEEEEAGHLRTAQSLIQGLSFLCPWQASGQDARLAKVIEERSTLGQEKELDLADIKRAGQYSMQRLQRVLEDSEQSDSLAREDDLYRDWLKARRSAAQQLLKVGTAYSKARWHATALKVLQEAQPLDPERFEKPLEKEQQAWEKAREAESEATLVAHFSGAESLLAAGAWRIGKGEVVSPPLEEKAGMCLTANRYEGTWRFAFEFGPASGLASCPGIVLAFQDVKNHALLRPRLGTNKFAGGADSVFLDLVQVKDGEETVLETKAIGDTIDPERWNPFEVQVLGSEIEVRMGGAQPFRSKVESVAAGGRLGLWIPAVKGSRPVYFRSFVLEEIVP